MDRSRTGLARADHLERLLDTTFPGLLPLRFAAHSGHARSPREAVDSGHDRVVASYFGITQVIVECQLDFLENGIQHLRPLTRAEVGERIGMHESTVSRATAGKFVLLPSGEVVAFSMFFTASLGVKDVILPGEIRELVNKVVEAERTAKANLIRRQEETAATRSLLNTAKLMEDNPLLLRLKELESIERLVEKVGRIDLHAGDGAGFDALLTKLVRLKADEPA